MSKENQHSTVTNPFSSGGGGTVFEMKVETGLLASLLVRAHAPGFESAVIHELNLQAEHLGYATDDAVVIAKEASGLQRRQLWSVKHEVRFTEKDSVLQDVLRDAWTDYSNLDLFNPDTDILVLATAPLPATYRHVFALLEIIRATSSYSDFTAKLARKGFISNEASGYFTLLTKLSAQLTGTAVETEHVWRFLRCFHVLSFDFDQTASKDEARFKTLLALAIRPGDGETGSNLWNTIFSWVANKNSRGGTFQHDVLPDSWKLKTVGIASHFESGVIERFREHSKLTLRRVRTEIGPGIRLPRTDIIKQISTAITQEPLTLISGEAGVGKSAAVLMALQVVAKDTPVFVFQAKEFAYRHLDDAFASMRIYESVSQVSALFGLCRQKLILLESVERLLEAPERDAFFDLLAILADDPTWRVALTCRHYAVTLVIDAFLTPAKLHPHRILIPRLDQTELDLVLSAKPGLQSIIKNERTRNLLKVPWFLDKACLINWTKEMAQAPLDQSRLREVLWQEVVMRVNEQQGGIHRKRERVFREIAISRARSMNSFVAAPKEEERTVQALIADELLVEDGSTGLVAPAHDVLEDWALVQWVAKEFEAWSHDCGRLFRELGNHLPVRRAYRQWLQESLNGPYLPSIQDFADAVLSDTHLPHYWTDETIVSILLSDDAPRFISDHASRLMEGTKKQLKIVIHLLRLVCKKPNPMWDLPEQVLAEKFGDMHLIPDGVAWEAIIQLIHRHLPQFDISDLPYLLGLLKDWKSGGHWQTPSLPSAREAVLIAIHFWNSLDDDYHWEEELEQLLDVILTSPATIPKEFELAVTATMTDNSDIRSHRAELMQKKILAFISGGNACRSHPLLVANFARNVWMIDRDVPSRRNPDWVGATEMESHFGLPYSLFEYFPASALQGPFYALLMSHPTIGIDLIIDLINITTLRYVERGLDTRYGDGPIEIEISLKALGTIRQWVSPRLWLLHRGAMPGPHAVESALMALEKYLLDLASQGHHLQDLTQNLLHRSNSVAVTAVVASIAMAHPEKVGDTILALLRIPVFFELDQQRSAHDRHYYDIGGWADDALQKLHYHERLESSKLLHRRENFESLMLRLQTGALREEIWSILDDARTELESLEEQTEQIKLLRFKYHRMDIRNFEAKEKLEDGRTMFASRPPEADIAEVIDKRAPRLKESANDTELIVWGMTVFERKDPDKFAPSRWKEMLARAQDLAAREQDSDEFGFTSQEGGPGYVAAICVRDHWKDLNLEQRTWCRDYLLSKVNEHKDTRDEVARSFTSMSGHGVAAAVLPLLLDDADDATTKLVRESIAAALTHAVADVRSNTAASIRAYLWTRDSNLAMSCVSTLIKWAKSERSLYNQWISRDWKNRGKWEDFIAPEISRLRHAITHGLQTDNNSSVEFAVGLDINPKIILHALNIISDQHQWPVADTIYLQLALYFVSIWKKSSQRDSARRENRDFHGETALRARYAAFVVRADASVASNLWRPFAVSIENHADEVSKFIREIVIAEDAAQRGEGFWRIWNDTQKEMSKIGNLDKRLANERGGLAKLASSLLFDNIHWKTDARDWIPAHGHENELRDFAWRFGATPPVCKSLIRLLSGIGFFLLPSGFLWINEALKKGNAHALIGGKNELFNLACILTPFVFGKTSAIHDNKIHREAILQILDAMVDQGSPAAYRMRDSIISPYPFSNLEQ